MEPMKLVIKLMWMKLMDWRERMDGAEEEDETDDKVDVNEADGPEEAGEADDKVDVQVLRNCKNVGLATSYK